MTAVPAPTALLFDWDNTLVNTWPSIRQTLNVTFEEYGLPPWSEEEFAERLGPSVRDAFPEFFGDRWEEAGEFFYKTFETLHIAGLEILPGAEALLSACQDLGLPMALVSNKTGKYLRKESAHLGWEGYFVSQIGATDADEDKPAAAPAFMALNAIGVEPNASVWFLGDSETDLMTAKNAGLTAILVRQEPPEEGEFASCPPAAWVKNCGELQRFIHQQSVHSTP